MLETLLGLCMILLLALFVVFLYCAIQLDKLQEEEGLTMFECFHCLHKSLIWDCDYDFDDYGYEGEGIVQVLHCTNCGAEVEYVIRFNSKEE